ncbi:MAG: hypothetical protein KA791_16375, partial [Flavobacteriales bacterium]|nr:hypothetical protein [Flavobacteriales bacterium]
MNFRSKPGSKSSVEDVVEMVRGKRLLLSLTVVFHTMRGTLLKTMVVAVGGLCTLPSAAQVFTHAWQASGTANQDVTAIRFTSTGHVVEVITGAGPVVIGTDTLPYPASSYLASYSASGALDWVAPVGHQLLNPGYMRRSALAVTSDDTIHFVGTFTDTGMIGDTVLTAPGNNVFLATFTSDGDLVRVRIIGGELRPVALEPMPGGDLVLGATSRDTTFMIGSTTLSTYGSEGVDILLTRMDRHGNIIWYDQSGGASYLSDNIADLAVHPDGAIAITGRIRSDAQFDTILQTVPDINPHGFVARYSAGGTAQWVKLFGYEPEAVAVDADGNCYVAGFGANHIDPADIISGNPSGVHYLASIDSVGEVNWVVMPDDGNYGFARDIAVNANGDAWVAGNHRTLLSVGGLAASAAGGEALMVFKTDRFGTAQWVSLSGSGNATSDIEALCIAVDDSCGVAVGGTYWTSGSWDLGALSVPQPNTGDALTAILDGCDLSTGAVPPVPAEQEW